MVRKKIEFTMIKDKSRLRSTRNKRLVGLLKKEMKLNRLTAMPFASFYFVDDQLVRIASADPDFMIQKVLNHIRSGKSVQTLTPDDLEKLTNNELKIGVRRGNRGPYFSDDCKTSQAHLSREEQMIAMQTASNLRAAAEGTMHGMSSPMAAPGVTAAGSHASGGRQRNLSEASSSQSSNRDDDVDDMSENDDADGHDKKPITIKLDPNIGSNVLHASEMSGALTSSNSAPLALAASNLLSCLPMTTGMGGGPMSEEDRNPAGSPSSSSGNLGIQLPINYHLHQHLMLGGGSGSGSSSVGRKRPRDGSDEYSVAMSQIEDRMNKEGMMIKEDPNAVQQSHQRIAGVPSLPPSLDIASLMQTFSHGGGAPTLDLSNTSSALSHLLATAGGPSGSDLTHKFSALASILNNPGAHHVAPPQPPPPGGPGSVSSAAELFSTNFSHPPQMSPTVSSSIQPPSSSSLGAPHPPRDSADLNFASKLKVASSFLANDAIAPPSGPPPSGGPQHLSQGTSSGSRRPNLDMMSVLK